jgi:adenylate kinase
MKRRIVLLGPPGSGKGTVASRLQDDFGFKHVSSGYWLRQEVESGSEMGRQMQVFLDKGELVPDEIVLGFMKQRLEAELPQVSFVLDGFPRTIAQAKALDHWLERQGLALDLVLFCQCSESIIIDRISGRRVCSSCGRGYHVRGMPPQVPDVCDYCKAALVQRDDDTEPVVRQRFKVYSRLTRPLVDYYNQQGKLVVVDATQPLADFYASSVEALKK